MGQLVNQHQLAAKLKRSRASLIAWARDGMPVARRGGPGRATLYDVDRVTAWIRQTGRGMRPELEPIPLAHANVCTVPDVLVPPAQIPAEDLLMGRVLEHAMGGIVTLLIARGVPDEAALDAFDVLLMGAYSALEAMTGRNDSFIPTDGVLSLLMDEDGRKAIIAHAKRGAPNYAPHLASMN